MSDPVSSEEPLFRVFTKATTAEDATFRRSENWVTARRGWLRFFADRLTLGDWLVPYGDIRQATLFRITGLIGGYVLRVVTTADRHFQFGMNPWALRGKTLPFPHAQQEGRLAYLLFSIVIRVIVAIGLIVWALEKL